METCLYLVLEQLFLSSSEMYSHQDLLELLNKQRNLYEKDIKHWQSALESSTSMIQEVGKFNLDISTKLYSIHCLEHNFTWVIMTNDN